MRRFSSLLAILVIAIFMGTAFPAYAQSGNTAATLNGTVLDESGGVVNKASITLREIDTNRTYAASTNDSGFYAMPNLLPGHYELKVAFTGFANYTQTGITLTVGQAATINITLRVQARGEQVTVTGETPVVEPSRTEISQVIDTKQISSLPISGRLFTDFALLTPGVATGRTSLQSTITEFEVTRVSFGGMRDLSNLVTVDGADNINTATGSQRSTPPQEAVSEFRVVNNSFGAEYGRALGGIVNIVTRSGGNNLHGAVYDYLQNNATDARSLLQVAPQPDTLRQNQFGGLLSGPIRKDKTFYFVNYEGQRRGESPTYPTTLLEPVTLFDGTATTNLALINTAKAYLGLPPENLNILKTKDNDYGIVKVDDQIGANNRITIRYSIEDGRDLNQLVGSTLDGGGIGAPSSGHNVFVRDQSLVGTWTSNLKPNLVNTLLLQYARRHYNFPGVTGQPNLDIPNSLLFGHNFGVLDAIYESRLQAADSLSWVKGNHIAKFGVDFNYVNNFVTWPGFTPMRIVLPGINCLVDFANYYGSVNNPTLPYLASAPADGPCPIGAPPFFPFFPSPAGPPVPPTGLVTPNPNDVLNGTPIVFWGAPVGSGPIVPGSVPPTLCPGNVCTPDSWSRAYLASETANFSETLDHNYYGFYAQDQWRLTSKLTMNYGLRYDFETGLWKQINPDYKGFQPRIGFAYSPNSKTVIRSGFGIFDDRYNLSFLFITQPQRPVIIPGEALPGIRVGANSATWVLNQLTFGQSFLTYPDLSAVPQPAVAGANLVNTGLVPANFITGNPPSAITAGAGMVEHNSKIPYSEQANLEIDREIGKGLTISAGYMWVAAHHLVRAENLNVCPPAGAAPGTTVPEVTPGTPSPACAILAGLFPAPPDWPTGKAYFSGVPGGNAPYLNSGLLYYTDNSGNSVYNGLTLQVVERSKYFSLDANYTYSHTLDDGTFTTFVSTPQDLYDRALERANSNQNVGQRFITNFTATAPQDSFLRNFQLSGIVTLQSPRPFTIFTGFDANGDTNPVTDRTGNSGRNTYNGDDLYSLDLRVSRTFQFKEKYTLQLIVDAFNLFNRPNVDEVTSVYGTYNFCNGGQIPHSYKDAASLAVQNGSDFGTCPVAGPPLANTLFGTPRTMLNPRQFQFAAKFSF